MYIYYIYNDNKSIDCEGFGGVKSCFVPPNVQFDLLNLRSLYTGYNPTFPFIFIIKYHV